MGGGGREGYTHSSTERKRVPTLTCIPRNRETKCIPPSHHKQPSLSARQSHVAHSRSSPLVPIIVSPVPFHSSRALPRCEGQDIDEQDKLLQRNTTSRDFDIPEASYAYSIAAGWQA